MIKIIAECGINHDGDVDKALDMIDIAKVAGADYIKFQTFKADELCTPDSTTSRYIHQVLGEGEDFRGLLKRLELDYGEFMGIKSYCDNVDIGFMSTAFDVESLKDLIEIGIDTIKIASGDITDVLVLDKAKKSGLPIILSTGLADESDIVRALDILKECEVTLLHCVSLYPTELKELGLDRIKYLKKFKLPVGFSDHTENLISGAVAVGMGVTIIEKHFTLDKTLDGPDHSFSLNPQELTQYIQNVRDAETMVKHKAERHHEEVHQRLVHRKSVVARTDIKRGEKFTLANLTLKRPGSGLSPHKLNEVLGKESNQELKIDTLITKGDYEPTR